MHASDDMLIDLNDPAAQALTFNPAPVYPASAKHAVSHIDPDTLWVWAGQASQVLFV